MSENKAVQTESSATPTLRFIREADELTDAFGGHTRVAEAMSLALRTNPELQVVGLFGRWGSGKSRVVRLLQERMEAGGALFFVYDAWLNQSDSPRRAFLEALVSFLEARKRINGVQVRRDLELLLGKREVTVSKVRPSIPIGGSFLLTLVLAVPLAVPFLRPEWMELDNSLGLAVGFGLHEVGLVFALALAAAAAPVLVVAFSTILRLLLLPFGISDRLGALAAPFANKIHEEKTEEKHKEPDPSALEFQRFVAKLVEAIGTTSPAKKRWFAAVKARDEDPSATRLILVFDNLDRLPEEEFEKLWSTLRTLFHGEAVKQAAERLTVILPVDEQALRRLRDDDDERLQGFNEKTFDLAFRVPTPIESAWQKFLSDRINQVFCSETEPSWPQIAARMLENLVPARRTPRLINRYVNELATLWLQWRDEGVSFAAIAYFAANRVEIERDPWGHLQHSRPWMEALDEDWTRGVAAIVYGAPLARAGELLLEPKLRVVIDRYDTSGFDELKQEPGFRSVLRRLVDTSASASLTLSHCIALLTRVEGEDLNIRAAWSTMYDVLMSAEWRPQSEVDLVALDAMLGRWQGPRRDALAVAIVQKLQRLSEPSIVASAPLILRVVETLRQQAQVHELVVELPSMPSASVALALAATDPSQLQAFRHQSSDEQVGVSLASRVEEGLAVEDAVRGARNLVAWGAGTDQQAIVRSIIQRVAGGPPAAVGRTLNVIASLWTELPGSNGEIAGYAGSQIASRRVRELLQGGAIDDAAKICALALMSAQEIPAPGPGGWDDVVSSSGALPKAIANALSQFAPALGLADLMQNYGFNSPALPLVRAVARARFATHMEAVEPAAVAQQVRRFLDFLPLGAAREFWAPLEGSNAFWRALVRSGSNKEIGITARAMLQETASGPAAKRLAARALAQILADVSTNDWLDMVENGNALFAELQIIERHAPAAKVSGHLEAALTSTVPFVCQTQDPQVPARWFTAVARLRKAARGRVYRALRDQMIVAGTPHGDQLIRQGGERFTREGQFAQAADEVVIRIVVDIVQRSGGVLDALEEPRWLHELVGSASADAKAQLSAAAKQRLLTVSDASPLHGQLNHIIQLTQSSEAH